MFFRLESYQLRKHTLLGALCLLGILSSCVHKSEEEVAVQSEVVQEQEHDQNQAPVDTVALVEHEPPDEMTVKGQEQAKPPEEAIIIMEESSEPPEKPVGLSIVLEEQQSIGVDETSASGEEALKEYVVKLAVSEAFKLHEKGELKVWIGADSIEVSFGDGMIEDETTVPANIGQFARVEPYAPDFDITPPVRECVNIHPSGSEVRFTLEPKTSGDFSVSANIELFTTDDCTGISVPKTAKTLTVQVTVDKKHVFNTRLSQMGEELWNQFFTFWGALLTLLFGAALFVVRRYVKNRTGYSESEE